MKLKESSLDIYAFVKLNSEELEGSFIKKVHQTGTNEFVLQVYRSDLKKRDLLISLTKGIAFFEQNRPETPSNLSMMLRKNLSERKILSVEQINFDRIVRLNLSGGIQLVLELFREGNLVLIRDGIIEYAFNPREWKNRKVTRGNPYLPPPAVNPLSLDLDGLSEIISGSKATIVQTLATRLTLGGEFAEEILHRMGEDKNTKAVSFENTSGLMTTFRELLKEATEGPGFYYEEAQQVSPIRLNHLKEEPDRVFPTFSEAISYYLSHYPDKLAKETPVERRIRSIGKSIEEFSEQSAKYRTQGDLIFSRLKEIDQVISRVNQSERDLRPGDSIGGKYPLKEFNPAKKTCTVTIDSVDVELKYNQKATINGTAAFEESKNFLNKIEGAKKVLEEMKSKVTVAETKSRKKNRRIFWFEAYRWFFTDDGSLVVSGKDRKTNEKVVKKHMSQYDIYVHADLYGAGSTIVKAQDQTRPGEESIRAACQFAICNSRAWAAGQGSGSAYWVFPEQVSKTPESGEYVTSGSWIIRGKRNYLFNLPLELYIGAVENDGVTIVMISPNRSAFKGNYAKLTPGDTKRPTAVKKIAERLDVPREEVEKLLPPGSLSIVEFVDSVKSPLQED